MKGICFLGGDGLWCAASAGAGKDGDACLMALRGDCSVRISAGRGTFSGEIWPGCMALWICLSGEDVLWGVC